MTDTSSHDPFNTQRPVVYELVGLRRILFNILYGFLWLYTRTWRIHLSPQAKEALLKTGPARMIVTWHNRSFVMTEVFRRFFDPERVACLISPSKNAAWEVAFFRRFKIKVIRGSTTRRSVHAIRELIRELRAGNEVAISPDGPSGPLYSWQPGAIAIARKVGVPLLFVMPNTPAARRLKTWDRHLIPYPFARIDVKIRAIQPDDPLHRGEDPDSLDNLRRVCLEMTDDPFTLPNDE